MFTRFTLCLPNPLNGFQWVGHYRFGPKLGVDPGPGYSNYSCVHSQTNSFPKATKNSPTF